MGSPYSLAAAAEGDPMGSPYSFAAAAAGDPMGSPYFTAPMVKPRTR